MWNKALTETSEGVYIDIDVSPGSKSTGLKGYDEWRKRIKVSVKEEARDGKANSALTSFLSELLGISGSHVTITAGHTSSQKRVLITGIEKSQLIEKLEGALGPG